MPTRLNLFEEVSLVKSPTVNLGLTRRKSLLTRRSNSRHATAIDDCHPGVPGSATFYNAGPRVPVEMLEEIIKFFADGVLMFARVGRESLRVVFRRDIKPLTLASRDIRYLILQQFCKNIGFVTQRDVNGLFDYLTSVSSSLKSSSWSGFAWVRTLATPAFLVSRSVFIIKNFTNLRDIHIECSHCSLLSQFSTLSRLFDALAAEENLLPNALSLSMTSVPRVDENLLKSIAKCLPQLTTLHVSTVEGLITDCCQTCYAESLSHVMHSPICDLYPDGEVLAANFALVLERFSQLKHLHLGIFLSRYDLLEKHTDHGQNDGRPCTVKGIANCLQCSKYAKETKRRELAAGLLIASRISSLEVISWATAFSLRASGDGKTPEENSIECGVRGSLYDVYSTPQYSCASSAIVEDGQHDGIEDSDQSSHCKVANFVIQRRGEKIILIRAA